MIECNQENCAPLFWSEKTGEQNEIPPLPEGGTGHSVKDKCVWTRNGQAEFKTSCGLYGIWSKKYPDVCPGCEKNIKIENKKTETDSLRNAVFFGTDGCGKEKDKCVWSIPFVTDGCSGCKEDTETDLLSILIETHLHNKFVKAKKDMVKEIINQINKTDTDSLHNQFEKKKKMIKEIIFDKIDEICKDMDEFEEKTGLTITNLNKIKFILNIVIMNTMRQNEYDGS